MKSPALLRFLSSFGRVQHHLHTAIVALSTLERDKPIKPDDLDISWAPKDIQGSVREARRFLLRSTLVFAGDELAEYAEAHLLYRRFNNDSIPESVADRLRLLSKGVTFDPPVLLAAVVLIRQWRNTTVHKGSLTRLYDVERKGFLEQAEIVRTKFKNIDVTKLLQDCESDQPTLKDVTVLIAMAIRFVSQVDACLPPPKTSEEVAHWLQVEKLLDEVLRMEKQRVNGGSTDPREPGRQLLRTKAPSLADAYYEIGAG